MAVTRASKLISLTEHTTGGAFTLSTNKIISFQTTLSTKSLITYFSQRGKIVTKVVDEAAADIHTATASDTLFASQALTLVSGDIIYVMSDRIIYIDTLDSTYSITYDIGSEAGLAPVIYEFSTPTAVNLNTANGNTFIITTQPTSTIPSTTRYVNNLFVDMVVGEAVGDLPTLAATYKIKVESVAPSAGGAGYTAATVAFAGGGSGAVLPTATATVAVGAVTLINIITAGSNITADVTCTISGDGAGALGVNVIHHILDTLTVTDGGSNLNTAPTVTFSAGTVTALATTTLDAQTQEVTGTTITNVGSYLASVFPPTITIAGGSGSQVLYDEKKTSFKLLQLEETVATVKSAVNAL